MKMVCPSQVENRRSCNHQFYIVKLRPSLEEIKKDEAYKKYHLLSTTAHSINKEIEQLKADEEEINRKLKPIYNLETLIYWRRKNIKNLERMIAYYEKSPKNSGPRKTGVIYLTEIDARRSIRPDLKRCQKRLINKGQMDIEYLQQVEEELLSSKKNDGMTSCGTQELNDLMNSMAQRIQHGSKNRKEEMKIHDKLRELKITREIYTAPEPEPSDCGWRSEYREKRMEENERQRKQSWPSELKIMLFDFEIMKKNQKGFKTKVMRFEAKLQHVKKDIISLRKELKDVDSERKITYDLIQMFRKQETCYDEYQSLLTNVKEAAQTGDVAKVKQLCDTQVEGFMAQWNDNQAFRDDYQARKLIDA